jgi:hypothetical protein
MTSFEIALAVRNRADPDEDLQAFVLRTMAKERIADLGAALELCIAWERACEDLENLLDALRVVGVETSDVKIAALIAAKRKIGYDAKFEAILARRWRCPHCKQFATIDKVELPIGEPDRLPCCAVCGEEGIAPVDTDAKFGVRDGGKSGLRPV